jgi:hypothetical protein
MKRSHRAFASPRNLRQQDVLEDRFFVNVAAHRLQAIREGSDELLDEKDFWAKADRIMYQRG